MDRSAALDWFRFHEPTHEQALRCIRVRTGMMHAVDVFLENSDVGADQTAALRKAKDALLAMIGAIVAPMPPDTPRG